MVLRNALPKQFMDGSVGFRVEEIGVVEVSGFEAFQTEGGERRKRDGRRRDETKLTLMLAGWGFWMWDRSSLFRYRGSES